MGYLFLTYLESFFIKNNELIKIYIYHFKDGCAKEDLPTYVQIFLIFIKY